MKDVESAKEVIKDLMNMCKAGGFHLTKFISNNKELILSIPESQRRICFKDQYLSGQLPNEKEFGICWEIGDNAFAFKIMLDGRPLTKMVTLSVVISIFGFAALFILEGRRILQRLCEQNVQQTWSKWKKKMKHIE